MDNSVKNILILGGKGQMGALFGRLLLELGHKVAFSDKGDSPDFSSHEIVIVAVSMQEAEHQVKLATEKMGENTLLCDINSLKGGVCKEMESGKCEALGMHPLFGPKVESIEGQKIVICPVRSGKLSLWWQNELKKLGFELIATGPKRHDEMMALVQVMPLLVQLVQIEALKESGHSIGEIKHFSTASFSKHLEGFDRLFSQNKHLSAQMVLNNPNTARAAQSLKSALDRVLKAEQEGQEAFIKEISILDHYFKTN